MEDFEPIVSTLQAQRIVCCMCLCFLTCIILIFLATLNRVYKVLIKVKERLEIPSQRILCQGGKERHKRTSKSKQSYAGVYHSLPFGFLERYLMVFEYDYIVPLM